MENRILEAAERLFLENGYSMTSTTAIAREAGCNQALVHYYFRTKERLFLQVFERKVHLFIERFAVADRQGGSFEDKLRLMIAGHFDILSQNPKLPLFIINEIIRQPDRVAALRKALGDVPEKLLGTIQRELDVEIAAGRVRPIRAVDLMMNIISLNLVVFLMSPVARQLLHWSESEQARFAAERKEEIINTILRSIRTS